MRSLLFGRDDKKCYQHMHDIATQDTVFITQKIIILDNNNILLIHRSATAPTRPLEWDFPGGALAFGEDPVKGITRETAEETGLTITEVRPLDISSFLADDTYTLFIMYTTNTVNINITLSNEHDRMKWVSKEELLMMDVPEVFKDAVRKLEA